MATPSLRVVEECLHLGSVAVIGHPTDGHESVADRQQGEVGAREVHLGSRGGDTEELTLKRLKKIEAFNMAVWFNTRKHQKYSARPNAVML